MKKYFITGLLIWIPVVITFVVLALSKLLLGRLKKAEGGRA